MNRISSASYTLLMFLGQFRGLPLFKSKKRVAAFRAKKGASVLIWLATKNSVPLGTWLRNRPDVIRCRLCICNEMRRIATKFEYNHFFSSYVSCFIQGRSNTPPVVTSGEAVGGVQVHGQDLFNTICRRGLPSKNSKSTARGRLATEFLAACATSKQMPLFYPKTLKPFF